MERFPARMAASEAKEAAFAQFKELFAEQPKLAAYVSGEARLTDLPNGSVFLAFKRACKEHRIPMTVAHGEVVWGSTMWWLNHHSLRVGREADLCTLHCQQPYMDCKIEVYRLELAGKLVEAREMASRLHAIFRRLRAWRKVGNPRREVQYITMDELWDDNALAFHLLSQ